MNKTLKDMILVYGIITAVFTIVSFFLIAFLMGERNSINQTYRSTFEGPYIPVYIPLLELIGWSFSIAIICTLLLFLWNEC